MANSAVALGNPLPVHLNGQQQQQQQQPTTFSQAPTLAPSSSSRSSAEEKNLKSHGADSSSAYSSSHDPEKNAGHSGFAADDHEHVDDHHVDVNKAKEQFHALERRMSERSSLHRARTRQSLAPGDVEKQDDDEEWNLMDYMKGNHEIREREGFRHKEVGVVWNGLTVVGGGGMSEFEGHKSGVLRTTRSSLLSLPPFFRHFY
jgi:hypothetical protein